LNDTIEAKPRVVLFDFDGVLFRGDSFSALMRHHARQDWWRIVLALPLFVVCIPFIAWGRTRRRTLRLLVHTMLLGVSEQRYRAMAQEFGRGLAADANHFLQEGLQAIKAHAESGARVIVVTGCEDILARTILDELGLHQIELVASRLAAGRLGMRVSIHTFGPEKVRQLANAGINPPWDIAYSDSSTDADMLGAAHSAVLVNGKPGTHARLVARMGREPDAVIWR
jgi:phosphatidylglycerophosphatase C